jgi:hypothetical protein
MRFHALFKKEASGPRFAQHSGMEQICAGVPYQSSHRFRDSFSPMRLESARLKIW